MSQHCLAMYQALRVFPQSFVTCLLFWVGISVLLISPTFAQTITHVSLFTFDGDSIDDHFGNSVSGAGDVNGDGFDDLIVGAPGHDSNIALCDGSVHALANNVQGSVVSALLSGNGKEIIDAND